MVKNQENILILPDIRSAQNVGAIFRTAEAVGISKIFLTGVSPCPLDRFNKTRKDIAKSALGAELTVPWEYKKNLTMFLNKLKKEKFKIIAIEQDKKSISYKKVKLSQKNAFIVGTEVSGLPKNILKKCDQIAEIPMLGKKESLNVSVATGIALFGILNI
ncbi:MAG: TrmH family RNA methyltransferase [Patescibacteria group bacterium]